MKAVRFVFLKIYLVWVLIVFSVFMVLYLPGILVPFVFGDKAASVSFKFLKLWSWTFSKLNFIPYHIKGRENIGKGKAYIYVGNHTSYLDIPGITLTIPTQFRPLAKKELQKIPVFGWIARSACIIVDRSSNESRRKSMEHLKEVLAMGISILIFPEGTQNRTQKRLQPFFDGAFRIAIETKQPILPIVVLNAGKLMPPHKLHIEPGTIRIVVGKEIPTAHLTLKETGTLKQKVFATMEEMILENQ
ncbi:MAG: 1-acyl-sn-glycerol-3-phosphate acyltransferase [Cyclobacteriaceae bacterium]|nr:1-acyl-sn-glycerol-3-phosphate acyltransferase [Cyclobacteriaceae bacterium]MCB0500193.1 1-acyl-sn-glycerol-3-phosphate acyltransferase [Cyclobacteriaceae bacterium]MCB9237079.1 1-acyl-sn-glycerol-3-phosphate acyltransferase [Flammeovirgaceae bacterium]MCO5271726.1 1-acyl-sn-glycerol-3-phosphate acyltransferase [Cyclobacteriaceae bacterium]MCW5901210.1 1-acyl-sn-glycerol-3-phosphate acyltransferase [Cyclobacteriaceae bacterium]